MSEGTPSYAGGVADRTSGIRRVIDWVIAVLLVIFGLLMAAGGALVAIAIPGRQEIEDELQAENIDWNEVNQDVDFVEITESGVVDAIADGGLWLAIGILLAGLAMLVGGLILAWKRYGYDQQLDTPVPAGFWSNALVGAVLTTVLPIDPFSALAGGGVAGFLHLEDAGTGAFVGAVSGALAMVPLVIVALFGSIGLMLTEFAVIGVLVIVGTIFLVLLYAGLSAVGGFLGAVIRQR